MQNIVLDFTAKTAVIDLVDSQPLAVMTARLAKKLLSQYAQRLHNSSMNAILDKHVHELQNCLTVEEMVEVSIAFIEDRQLIKNVLDNNWDAYSIPQDSVGVELVNQMRTMRDIKS